jgi:translocation and assembly module TamB
MGRALSRLVVGAGWALLVGLALLGVSLSAVVGLSSTALGGRFAAGLLSRQVEATLAGRMAVEEVTVLPHGGLGLRGLRVYDPDGHLVLQASRARLFPDLTRLRGREVGLVVELDGPSFLLETGPDGGVSLVRAFAPAPSAAGSSWTLRLERLTVRGGELWWRRQDRSTAVEASGLDVDAEGTSGPAGGVLALHLRAAVLAPLPGPLELDGAARLQGDRLEVPVLKASLGSSALEVLAEGNLATHAFRAVARRLELGAAEARRLVPSLAPGGDLAGTAYAESNGALATVTLEGGPAGAGSPGGTGRISLAARLPLAAPALGFDVALAALDPSRLLAEAPPGQLTLTARGAAAGHALADGTGRLALQVAPSRLRHGELGPLALTARADRGLVEVEKVEARLPGLTVTGSGRWRDGRAVGGDLAIEAADLARLGSNLAALTGQPLPVLGGRLRARVTLAGSAAAPTLTATVEAPLLTAGVARVEAVTLSLDAAGPLSAARGRLAGSAARASVGATEARRLELAAALVDDQATLSLSGLLGGSGSDPVKLNGAARLAADRHGALVRALSLDWPGARLALVGPASVTFAPLGVDRLELASGARRVVLSGGLGPKDRLDVRLEARRLDLSQVPRDLLPSEEAIRGDLTVDVHATGTTRRPSLAGHLTVAGGEVRGLSGLELLGDLRWDAAAARLAGSLRLRRAAGGVLDLAADLPLPLAQARPGERLALTVEASAWPVEALRQAAEVDAPVNGTLGGRLALSGTVAAPGVKAALALDEASLEDLGPLAAAVALEQAGGAVRVSGAARLGGDPLLTLDVRLPLDLAGLLRRPEATARGLRQAPLTGSVEVPGLELAAVAGKAGLPEGLAGTVRGSLALEGSLAAPRFKGTASLAGGAVSGYRDLSGSVELVAAADRTALALRASIGDAEALRLDAALGAAVERLSDRVVLRSAPLSLQATVPPLPLARVAGPVVPLSGTVSASLAVKGTLASLEGRLDLAGEAVEVEGRPLGDLTAAVRLEAPTATAELSVRPTAGGVLQAGATLAAPLGLAADWEALRRAPATLRVTSDQLDLGFLPAATAGLVRTASGLLTVDLTASGPLEGLRPRGTVKLKGGRLAMAELGEWSELVLDASLGEGAIEVSRLGARRGAGSLSGHLSVHDLGAPLARLDGQLVLKELTVARAGMEVATFDFPLELAGTWSDDLLDTTVTLPGGTIRLPKKSPRTLQSLEARSDIQVGRPKAKRAPWFLGATRAGQGAVRRRPFELRCHLIVPGKLFVKGKDPAVDVELKSDSTWRLVGGELLADGSLDLVRGTAEPISGRVFHLERGRVTFAGGGWKEGQLDVMARYDNPAAVATVTVGGTVAKPVIALSSRPVMDEPSIAMLIATGRAELKLNTSEVGTLTAQDAGMAAASLAVTMAFKGLVADKLPVDQISLDPNTLRAGKYLTERLFVGYARRFEAKPEKGENPNEVKAEYQLSPRWTFELRYGDAQAGDGSLIWSKDY